MAVPALRARARGRALRLLPPVRAGAGPAFRGREIRPSLSRRPRRRDLDAAAYFFPPDRAVGRAVRTHGDQSLPTTVPVRHVAALSADGDDHGPLPAGRALAGRTAAAGDAREVLEPDDHERHEVPRQTRSGTGAAPALRGHPGAAAR